MRSFVRSFVCLLVCLSVCLSACSPALAAGTTDSMISYGNNDSEIVPFTFEDSEFQYMHSSSLYNLATYQTVSDLSSVGTPTSGWIIYDPSNFVNSSRITSYDGQQFSNFDKSNLRLKHRFQFFVLNDAPVDSVLVASGETLSMTLVNVMDYISQNIDGVNSYYGFYPGHLDFAEIIWYGWNSPTGLNSPIVQRVNPSSFELLDSGFCSLQLSNLSVPYRYVVGFSIDLYFNIPLDYFDVMTQPFFLEAYYGQTSVTERQGALYLNVTGYPNSDTSANTQNAINNVNNTVQSGFNSTIASIQGMQQGLAQLSSAVEQQTNQMITSITQNAQQLIGSVTTLQNNIRDYFGLLEDTVESQVTQINQTITQTSTEIKQSISDVGSKVEQGFVDTGQKIDKVDESVQEVKDSVDSLPAKIKNVLLELFIPPEEELTAFYDKFSALMSSKLGFIWQVIDDILLGLFRTLMNGFTDPQTTITIPAVSLPFPGASMSLWPEMTFPIIPPGLEFLATFTKRLSDLVMVLLVINRALDFRNTFFEYYTAAAPVGEQIANEYFAEQDRKAANRAYYQKRANFAKARGRR